MTKDLVPFLRGPADLEAKATLAPVPVTQGCELVP